MALFQLGACALSVCHAHTGCINERGCPISCSCHRRGFPRGHGDVVRLVPARVVASVPRSLVPMSSSDQPSLTLELIKTAAAVAMIDNWRIMVNVKMLQQHKERRAVESERCQLNNGIYLKFANISRWRPMTPQMQVLILKVMHQHSPDQRWMQGVDFPFCFPLRRDWVTSDPKNSSRPSSRKTLWTTIR